MAYTKTSWQTGDIVTSEKLNHAEDGIEAANQNTLPAVTSDDNGDVLTVVEGAWAKAAPSMGLFIVTADVDQEDNITLDKTLAEIIAAYKAGLMPIMIMHSYGIGEGNISDGILFLTGITAYQGAQATLNNATFNAMVSVDGYDGVSGMILSIHSDGSVNVSIGTYPSGGD